MKVEFLKNFSRDLDNVGIKSVRHALLRLIELKEKVDSLDSIPNTKKLKGFKNA